MALYLVLAPVGPSGIAIVGDTDQFVTMGKKRVARYTDQGAAHVRVTFAAGETSRAITGYSPVAPHVHAIEGSIGPVHFDDTSPPVPGAGDGRDRWQRHYSDRHVAAWAEAAAQTVKTGPVGEANPRLPRNSKRGLPPIPACGIGWLYPVCQRPMLPTDKVLAGICMSQGLPSP